MHQDIFLKRPRGRHARPWTAFAAGAAVLLAALPQHAFAQKAPVTAPTTLSPALTNQIASLEAEKEARTPAQRKLDSQLIYAAKMSRGQAITAAVPTVAVGLAVNNDGDILVDIDGTISQSVVRQIARLGGTVVVSVPELGSVRALLPLQSVETLAANPDVRFIHPAAIATLRGHGPIPPSGLPIAPLLPATGKAARLRAALPRLLAQARDRRTAQASLPSLDAFASLAALIQSDRVLLGGLAPVDTGGSGDSPISGVTIGGPMPNAISPSNIEEGYTTHRANLAYSTYGVTGSGIKIGVLSDSVGTQDGKLTAAQNAGYVSTVTVATVNNIAQDVSGTDEGLAMLEIVHALAPGATLYFATGDNSEASFAQNIQTLAADGCNIILDDLGYIDESPFQDGPVAQAVRTVTNAGALYFSSAGNQGDLDSGNSTVWEGDYADSKTAFGTGEAHTFGTSMYDTATVYYNTTQYGQIVTLFWSDPLGASTNDYDLYSVNSSGSVYSASTTTQSGTQDPFEAVYVLNGYRLIVVKKAAAAPRFLHLAQGADDGSSRLQFATAGQTAGHNTVDTVGMFGVAAASAQNAYPHAFNSSDPFEVFTSDGPRHVFYNPDGTLITPGNLSSTGGSFRSKPDITAADGVNTALSGFQAFYGTSAAAPHAGAIAALLKSYNPSLTQSQIRGIFTGPAAIDIGAPGYDRDTGYGIVDAYNAVTYGNTVSGTVTASNGTPISGVTFAVAGQAATASTDSTGTYALSPLPVGTLTVTPSKAGFNFTPASQSVTVGVGQPNATASFMLSQASIRTSFSPVTVSGGVLSVTVTFANGGPAASGMMLTRASLGSASAPTSPSVPAGLAATATGNATSVTLQFPRSAGASGATVPLRISGTFTGGSFGGSYQVVLP